AATLPLLLLLVPADGPVRSAAEAPAPVRLTLRPGDRISILGNTTGERLQHDGWLETYLYSRFPTHDLVVRNLAFSGDELTQRIRSANFGSPDTWLAFNKSDVVFAFLKASQVSGLPKLAERM